MYLSHLFSSLTISNILPLTANSPTLPAISFLVKPLLINILIISSRDNLLPIAIVKIEFCIVVLGFELLAVMRYS